MVTQPPSSKPRSSQARSKLTDRKLIDATLALMRDGGLAACSAPEIARRAGVAVGTIYRRFVDKDDLVGAAIIDLVSLQRGEATQSYALMATEASDLSDFLARYIQTAIRISVEQRQFLDAVREYSRSRDDPDWIETYRRYSGEGRRAIMLALFDRFPFLRGREVDVAIALASIHGAINLCLVESSSGFSLPSERADEFVAALVVMAGKFLEADAGASAA